MPTISVKPTASNHDILVYRNWLTNWEANLTHNRVSVGWHAFTRYAQGAGIYFPNVQIPKGVSITNASLLVTSAELNLLQAHSHITVQDHPNPSVFSDLTDYQSRTPFYLIRFWTWGPYEKWELDKQYRSPELRILIQHLIDLPGWNPGNAMVIFWGDHYNKSPFGADHERSGYSFDDDPNKVPILQITYQEPPPPPPPIPIHHSTRDFDTRLHCNGYTITVLTDTPCHLWMRWSIEPPQKHAQPVLRRGLLMHTDIYLCFVAYNDNEQEEAGDTLAHTFIKRNWPVCQTRYFHFWGTMSGEISKSTTAVFKLHFNIETSTFVAMENNRTLYQTSAIWAVAHDAAIGLILPNYDDPWCLIFAGDVLTATFWIYRAALSFDTSLLTTEREIAGAYLSLFITETSLGDLGYPYLYITQGVQNSPVTPANYGDQLPLPAIGGQIRLDSLIPNQYNNIPLNDVGLAWILNNGITRFSLRGQKDIENRDSIAVYSNHCKFYSAQKGTGYRPLLTVCYPPS